LLTGSHAALPVAPVRLCRPFASQEAVDHCAAIKSTRQAAPSTGARDVRGHGRKRQQSVEDLCRPAPKSKIDVKAKIAACLGSGSFLCVLLLNSHTWFDYFIFAYTAGCLAIVALMVYVFDS
jgi:hypothetical protein